MNQSFDLSVILTAHDETLVSGPTLQAADASISCAEAAGISVERIIALDAATAATRAWFSNSTCNPWRRVELNEGDLGMARNTIIPQTAGRHIAFLDADDLFSENWLREGMRAAQCAEEKGEQAIVHPEINWLFDGTSSVVANLDQNDPLFTPYYFYTMNPYDSLCISPRVAHENVPYSKRDIPKGLSFQDWQFAIETMASGWDHICARDTVIFKRRRDASLVTQSQARRSVVRQLHPMAIDRVGALAKAAGLKTPALSQSPNAREEQVSRNSVPHYGATFDDHIARAKMSVRRVGFRDRAKYSIIKEHFDYGFYLAKYQDIAALEKFDPVAHYIRAGWKEGRDPAPWFSTRGYLARYEEVSDSGINPFFHYLKKGRRAGFIPQPVREFNTLAECLGTTEADAFALWDAKYKDLRHRLEKGILGRQVRLAGQHEPLIELGWIQSFQIKIPPFHSNEVAFRTAAIWRLNCAANHRRARYVICTNRARFGSAPRAEGNIARALSERFGSENVLVVTTDKKGSMPLGKLPSGVRVVDFAKLTPNLKYATRLRVLVEYLRALQPEAVFNVNSRALWDAMPYYGDALVDSAKLYACFFCNEQTQTGHWTGYPLKRLYRSFEQLTGAITDSQALAEDLQRRYRIAPNDKKRLRVLPNPVDPSIPVTSYPPRNARHRPTVFWAGRFDPQKRVDLVFALARALPDLDFRLWGKPVISAPATIPPLPNNLSLEGAYERFHELPLKSADIWLYTSAWDGVPSQLLEVAMTGIPIVGSDVGGTTEVLRKGLAKSLSETNTIQDWVDAIREILVDLDTARKRAVQLRDKLVMERSKNAHAKVLFELLDLPGR
ncbi:glycosyltransferase [Shimia abyssi]|uniref:Glycosyltransferase involved in cell wall biosynthesis n=1 Tax=Shimia abyssi TaxID=1662395 RepID=A0A2P8F767_9RHOB|nr:glycosyltransferase [Shimia abyssi]PSL17560.1 glycosyltransferase involved in cell wall biosynthesis [Shimia abyssi]